MAQIISENAIKDRMNWINRISELSDNFYDDAKSLDTKLNAELKENPSNLIDHLRLCAAIPESYGHDSSEEKLYS